MELLKKKNYLTMIENAAKGENWMFRNLYAEIDGKDEDILKNGTLSCAVFVSSILYLHKLVEDIHANVLSTVKDMIKSRWQEIEQLRAGAVLIWEKKIGIDDIEEHMHIGFYVGDNMAVSNDSLGRGLIHRHHYTYNNTRKIEKIYWHPCFDD